MGGGEVEGEGRRPTMIPQKTPRCFLPAVPETDRQKMRFKVILVIREMKCYSEESCNRGNTLLILILGVVMWVVQCYAL